MKDYLNSEERNQLMVLMSIIQMFNGNRGINGPTMQNIVDSWASRNNLTKDEQKSIKMAQTYLNKFCKSVYDRMCDKEKETIAKKLTKFDFRLIDDFTLQKVYRETNDKMKNAVVPREQFENWCRDIMEVHCKGCTKHHAECELHTYFEDNFVPESSWGLENCRYAYKEVDVKKDEKKIKEFQEFKAKKAKAV